MGSLQNRWLGDWVDRKKGGLRETMPCETKLRLVRVPQPEAQKMMVGWGLGMGTLRWQQELRPSLSAFERVSVLPTWVLFLHEAQPWPRTLDFHQ